MAIGETLDDQGDPMQDVAGGPAAFPPDAPLVDPMAGVNQRANAGPDADILGPTNTISGVTSAQLNQPAGGGGGGGGMGGGGGGMGGGSAGRGATPTGNTQITNELIAAGVPPDEVQYLLEAEDQWEQLTGYAYRIDPQTLAQAYLNGVTTEQDLGKYIARTQGSNTKVQSLLAAHPGAAYGWNDDQFNQYTIQAQSMWEELTGDTATQSILKDAFNAYGNDLQAWQQHLTMDANMRKSYGWLQYGMNYKQFQDWRSGETRGFGHELSKEESLAVLADQHQQQSTGNASSREVQAAPAAATAGGTKPGSIGAAVTAER